MEINEASSILKSTPSVMAFKRGIIVTDAKFEYGTSKDVNGERERYPVPVIRHGVLATQNLNVSNKTEDRNVANIQTTETAKTGSDSEVVFVTFDMKFLSIKDGMHSCTNVGKKNDSKLGDTMKNMYNFFMEKAIGSKGMEEISKRFARNILNGRWLWRNRTMASTIKITVFINDNEEVVVKNAISMKLNDFSTEIEEVNLLGDYIARNLNGEALNSFRVEAEIDFGVKGAIEVFCSQNYIPKDGSEKKTDATRSLYKLPISKLHSDFHGVKVVGQAAFRDAKVWNAIRTIDTWYDDYEDIGLPISIEPTGASLMDLKFHRENQNSIFDLLKRIHKINPDSDEGMFIIASILRGGVMSESKNDKQD